MHELVINKLERYPEIDIEFLEGSNNEHSKNSYDDSVLFQCAVVVSISRTPCGSVGLSVINI